MKRNHLAHLSALVVAGLALPAMAQTMVGQAHDFSSMSWSGGEICKPCHTPHNANTSVGWLWNHELTTATYTMHSGSGTAELDFDILSRLCLSCHDGTVALDSFGGNTGTSFIGGSENLGTDLSDDHPVGSDALYPPDPPGNFFDKFNDPATLPAALKLRDWDDAGTIRKVVSCMTCHTPHYKGFDHQLRMTNIDSAICLGCHIK